MKRFHRGYEREYLKRGVRLAQRRIAIPNGCWMCGQSDVKMSEEHVFPEWLLENLNCAGLMINPTHMDSFGRIIDSREQLISNLVLGRVCKINCNEGWMSKLEKDFKKCYLNGWQKNVNGNEILYARWIAKTVTTLNASQQRRVQIPEQARHELVNETKLPSGWQIYIYKTDKKNRAIDWMQGAYASILHSKNDEYNINDIDKIYGCSLKVGDLGTLAFWSPSIDWSIEPVLNMMSLFPNTESKLPTYPWNPAAV